MEQWKMIAAVAACLSICACGSRASEEDADSVGVASASLVSTSVQGYVHDLGHSKFRIGSGVGVETESSTLKRWRGSNGAFATDPTNGWSMAMPNARAAKGPYLLDKQSHGDAVRAYFVQAGVPEDQIAGVVTSYDVRVSGTVQGPSGPPELESITSILQRSINGVPVRESFAWAKMTTDGQVDMEAVFWPPVDSKAVSDATALAAKVGGADARRSYLRSLPGQVYRDMGVAIHHTAATVHRPAVAYASYDVTLEKGDHARMHHFDGNGVEIAF